MSFFGVNWLLDAFNIANRIPNLFRDMLAEGALSNAFTKVYSETFEGDPEKAKALFLEAMRLTFLAVILISVLGFVLSPYFVELLSIKLSNEEFTLNATNMTRVLFPYLGLTMLSSITMGVLHKHGRFFLSAVSPVAFNLGTVIGIVWISSWMLLLPESFDRVIADRAMMGVPIGVLVGGLGQLAVQWLGVVRDLRATASVKRGFSLKLSPEMKKVLKIMAPAAIAASTGPVNITISSNFATAAGEGAVSWLLAAFRVFQLPIGLFAVAIGVATLPRMTNAITRSAGEVGHEAARELQNAVDLVLWMMGFCLVYLAANHYYLTDLFYMHKKFTELDLANTANALWAYSFGVVGYGVIKVVTSFYYATERTSFPMKVAIGLIFVNLVMNFLLVPHFGFVGLAWTSTIVLTSNAAILFLGLKRYYGLMDGKTMAKSLVMLALAAVLSYIAQRYLTTALGDLSIDMPLGRKLKDVIILALNGVMGLVCFLLLGWRKFKRLAR
jgi:putative peptidoglycan lipid II flippase